MPVSDDHVDLLSKFLLKKKKKLVPQYSKDATELSLIEVGCPHSANSGSFSFHKGTPGGGTRAL